MLILEGHEHRVTCVAYAPGGAMIASGSVDGTVRLWDLPSGRGRVLLRAKGMGIGDLAFSPDGRTLATAELGGKVTLWDVETGRQKPSPERPANCLAFTPGGDALLFGGGRLPSDDRAGESLYSWILSKT